MKNIEKLIEKIIRPIYLSEIERKNMPQVKDKDFDEILRIFDDKGIKYEEGKSYCKDLHPIQDDYIPDKLENMKKNIESGEYKPKPIFVTQEGYILDGHHRFLAIKELYGDDYRMSVIKVYLPKWQALYVFSKESKELNKENLIENISKTIVVFSGRLQPFHRGHYSIYEFLIKKFGKDSVYIGTSNKVDPDKSPFNFVEKKKIITTMFDVPKNKVVQVKNPYKPVEILSKYDSNTTSYITAISEKDTGRLGGKYFQKYTGKNMKGYEEAGYFIEVPVFKMDIKGKNISGTQIRTIFSSKDISDKIKKELFKQMYGKYNEKIYDMIVGKLTESVILSSEVIEEFIYRNDILKLLTEVSQAPEASVDDGPATFYKNPNEYKKDVLNITNKIGWQVINYLAGEKLEYADHTYKYDHVSDVSFGNVGVRLVKEDPLKKYLEQANRFANQVGYEIVNWLLGDDPFFNIIKDKKNILQEPLSQENDNTEELSKIVKENLIKDIVYSDDSLDKRILLQCGAGFGHLSHVYDEWDLTFGDLRQLIENALEGKLEMVQEKMDGLNVLISWRNGQLVAARNKSHLKNFGEKALNIDGIGKMFEGRGEIHDAFVYAMQDLENAMSKLSNNQKEEIFNNGRKFMNIEIIYPQTTNVIPYGHSFLIFHGTIEYDESGNSVGGGSKDAKILGDMIRQTNQQVQKHFTLTDNPIISIPKSEDFSNQKAKYITKLNNLKKKFNLKDTDEVTMYHQKWWEDFITNQAKKFKYSLPNDIFVKLVKRWAFSDKSFRILDIKKAIDNDKFREWVISFDKKDHQKQLKENIKPFEYLFLELGAQILKNLTKFFTANPQDSVKNMKKNLDNTIKELEKSDDPKKIEKLRTELERLNAIGGFDAIVPTEGIVFIFKNKLMKLTGTFAALNQILGILKFSK